MIQDNDYEELENELDRRIAGRARKVGRPAMVVDGASTKILGKLIAERNSGR